MKRWPSYALYDSALAFTVFFLIFMTQASLSWAEFASSAGFLAVFWIVAAVSGRRRGLTMKEYSENIHKPAFESRDDYMPQR